MPMVPPVYKMHTFLLFIVITFNICNVFDFQRHFNTNLLGLKTGYYILGRLFCNDEKTFTIGADLLKESAKLGDENAKQYLFDLALNNNVVEKLSKKFGIDIDLAKPVSEVAASSVQRHGSFVPGSGFCPNPCCPTNRPYQVEGHDHFNPDRLMADPVGGRFCAMCGEALERKCPSCGAPVHAGGFCSLCGDPYVIGHGG